MLKVLEHSMPVQHNETFKDHTINYANDIVLYNKMNNFEFKFS